MRSRILHAVLLLVVLHGVAAAAPPAIELYGTFQSMGVTVTIGAGDDPDQDAVAAVGVRPHGGGAFQAGLPLARVASSRFVGSLFWLQPGTSYDVRVTLSDPDGGPLQGVVADATASTRAEVTIPTATRSLVVTPTGSGTACSSAAPCGIAGAIEQVQAGEEIVLRGGVYHEGGFFLPRSGRAGAPIVIRGAIGETAILDGADPGTFTWVAQGGGIYSTTTSAPDAHVVIANGTRLFPYQSLVELQSLRWGVPGFVASGTALSVRLAGDADPSGASMVVSRFPGAFEVDSQSFIYFVDLTFRHYGQGEYPKAIYFIESSDNLVQGCTFASNDLGVGLKYLSHRNVIQDNEFYDTIADFPWAGVKEVGFLEDGGVYVYTPMEGRGTVIRRNQFHDDFDALHVCPESQGPTNEIDVHDNTMFRMGDDGMETDGECSNVRIWGNTVHDVLMGISLAPVQTGPVYAIRNVIYGIGRNVTEGGGSGFKLNSGYDQSGPIYLFHNTVDAVTTDNSALTLYEPGSWKSLVARNNIWSGTRFALEHSNTTQPVDLDYDDLVTSQADELAWWQGLPETHLRTLAALQAATGQELHGLSVAPGFKSASGGDYSLAALSPLLDQGVRVPGVNDDFAGAAPDIGAREYRGATGCSVACSATVPTAAPATATVAFRATATTSSCTGNPSWDWDFGDGSSHATQQNPSHVYTTPGTYAWRLEVRADGVTCARTGAITVGAPPPSVTYLVPSVAHLPGAGSTRWRTDLAAVNRSGSTAALTLVYHSSAAPITRTTALVHGAAADWKDVLVSLFNLADTVESSGIVHLTSTMPLAVTSRTYNQKSATETFGQSYPALTLTDAITSERAGVLPQLRKSARFRTNVGVVNLGTATASVRVTLFNAQGVQVGFLKTFAPAAGRWVQQYDIFADVGAGSQEVAYATVEVLTPGGRVWAYASLIDVATGDPTTIPVLVP